MRFSDRVLMVYEMGTSPVNLMTLVQNFKRIRTVLGQDEMPQGFSFIFFLCILFYEVTGIQDYTALICCSVCSEMSVVMTLFCGVLVHRLWNTPNKDVSLGMTCAAFFIHLLITCYAFFVTGSIPSEARNHS
ncbi:hypothetical protein DFJ63DRAFT_314986 [Scheffersomyces coipomensis]|uniref:uncharacterized protein n=1 Tax=Scheffersomyces coipomensis TaxID=1788519 RepID=UPI00315D3F55